MTNYALTKWFYNSEIGTIVSEEENLAFDIFNPEKPKQVYAWIQKENSNQIWKKEPVYNDQFMLSHNNRVISVDKNTLTIDSNGPNAFPAVFEFVEEEEEASSGGSYGEEEEQIDYDNVTVYTAPRQPIPNKEFSHMSQEEATILNSYIPANRDSFFRITTYNIQEWKNMQFGFIPWKPAGIKLYTYNLNPSIYGSSKKTLQVIHTIDPDVLGIQESNAESKEEYVELSKTFDYQVCNADYGWFARLQNGIFVRKGTYSPTFDSVNITTYPPPVQTGVPRCMVVAIVTIKSIKVAIATLHLNYKQPNKMENIKNAIKYLKNKIIPITKNVILMGDFNTRINRPAYNYIVGNGFQDAVLQKLIQDGIPLTYHNIPTSMPSHPHWRIDFAFLSPQWDYQAFPILATYVYYTGASDHMPLIVDFGKPGKQNIVHLETHYLGTLID